MSWIKNHKILTAVIAFVVVAILASAGGGSKDDSNKGDSTTTTVGTKDPVTTTTKAPTTTTTEALSSCERVNEAFLTGSAADIDSALQALKADKAADTTARQYADYYLNRDKTESSMRELDKTLIQSVCSY